MFRKTELALREAEETSPREPAGGAKLSLEESPGEGVLGCGTRQRGTRQG